MLSLAELYQKKMSSIDKVEAFRLQQHRLLERGQRWFLLPALLLILGGGLFIWGRGALGAVCLGMGSGVFLLVGALRIMPAYTNYNDQFKRQVLYALLEDLYPSIYYAPDNYVPSSILAKSHLFEVGEVYVGKDYVEGATSNGETFRFSELSIEEQVANSNENRRLFEGLFLVVDIAKYCGSPIYILPTTKESSAEVLEQLIAQPLARFLSPDHQDSYHKNYSEFSSGYMVYSKDRKAPQAFLNNTLIEALYQWYEKWQAAAHLSFIGSQLFIALPMSKVFPVADFNQKSSTNNDLNRFYDQLLYCLSVVEVFGASNK